MFTSGTQMYVCFSLTEVELTAEVTCAYNDMLHVIQVLQFLGLKLKLPLLLEIDNIREVDLANNWSDGGQPQRFL